MTQGYVFNTPTPGTLTVPKGGTGATSFGDGYVLLGSGTDAITALDVTAKGSLLVGDGTTDPVALAVGANDTVLTADSAQASGTKWASVAGGGAWTYISSATASSSASVAFTGIDGTYDTYAFKVFGLRPATDGAEFDMQMGTGAGPTYSTTTHLSKTYEGLTSSIQVNNNVSSSFFSMAWNLGNDANTSSNGFIFLYDPAGALYTDADSHFKVMNTAASPNPQITGAQWGTTTAVTAVLFQMSTGNIAVGEFKLYGIKSS